MQLAIWQAACVGGDCANNIAHIVYTKRDRTNHRKITNELLCDRLHR